MPRVSIGLPVYNGENFIRDALDSILAQSYNDFELIISDNASTDRTQEICTAYAARDRRIRYSRNSENLGAAKNFNRTFELSNSEYFKWAAHDDVIAPTYLEKCVEILDSDPSLVLCHARTRFIDAQGGDVSSNDEKLKFHSNSVLERFQDLVLAIHGCFPIFGVMRAEILRKTALLGGYIASDRVLLGELSLHGRFHEIPEYLFSRRNHAQQSIVALKYRERAGWFDPKKNGRITFPTWRHGGEYALAIKRSSLQSQEKLGCTLVLLKWAQQRWKALAYDIYHAGTQLLQHRGMDRGESRALGQTQSLYWHPERTMKSTVRAAFQRKTRTGASTT